MIRENSGTIWYGAFVAIIFFSLRFLFESWDYPRGEDMLKSAYAGAVALPAGLLIGFLLRNQLELTRFITAAVLLAGGVLAYVFLA